MEKPFRPAPLETLAAWIFRELDAGGPVLGIPRQNFELPDPRFSSTLLGRTLAAPLGVAAGPHTQLAQNIVASFLCGARFIELKTVQVLDRISVARPCIDSADETYNCEWSQELTLAQSSTEYLNAWVLLHAIAHKLGLRAPGALFAMSVGYDLKGIESPTVQRFIASMRDASAELPRAIEAVAKAYPEVRAIAIPSELSNHITLSTMHGCPPVEIERIARYLLTELGVHTWVKLNPTLLGPETLRGLLNRTFGYDIDVPDAAFEHDPRFEDAMAMVKSLAAVADGRPVSFGIKLSNTLEVVNKRPIFPASEKMMYLSGRPLHPLTLTLAQKVIEATDGKIPVSFCGGADAQSFPALVADGLGPVTVCTDLLKPGGYARLQQYLVNLETEMVRVGAESLDDFVAKASGNGGPRGALRAHAERVAREPRYERRERPLEFKGKRPLGHFDCIAAPCQEACPSKQNIPDYLWLVAQGKTDQALDVILRTNALPAVTGSVCDRPCTERCVRNHYDAPIAIRELKRFVAENAKEPTRAAAPKKDVRTAIIGAGPAGLAAAFYLGRAGFGAAIFEAKSAIGGMVSGVIPTYRLSGATLERDLARITELGVEVHLGKALGRDLSLERLRADGFRYVFLAVGAQKGKRLGVAGDDANGVLDALLFLDKVRAREPLELGKNVLVIGGGNSAMDAARSARRLVGDGAVTLVYRRTRAQMPADSAEVRDCIDEGVGLRDLLAPAHVVVENGKVMGLACARMRLGEPDASGRPRPVPVEGPLEILPADTIIAAIGQEPLLEFLGNLQIARNRDGTLRVAEKTLETTVSGLFAGGDVVRGPSSVIKAIADGRAVAEEIARRHGVATADEPHLDKHLSTARMMERKARQTRPQTVPVLPVAQRGGFAEVFSAFSAEAAAVEASRCLDCDELCSLCVTVCPNRANHAYAVEPFTLTLPELVLRDGALVAEGERVFSVGQSVQIVNVGDFCNECGNCTTFCPTAGAPYRDKPRFWLERSGFDDAAGDAFHLSKQGEDLVLDAKLEGAKYTLRSRSDVVEVRSERVVARIDRRGKRLLGAEPGPSLGEGERVDLGPCATMLALLAAAEVLPA